MKLSEITAYLEQTLAFADFDFDFSNNGIQLEANSEVTRIAAGVDGCMELFEQAVSDGADLVLVHHGISWGSEPRRFTGSVARRLKFLFDHKISLFAAHLPLDAHPELGNNAELCRIAGIRERQGACPCHGRNLGFFGSFETPLRAEELSQKFGGTGKFFGDPGKMLRHALVLSGSGGNDAVEETVARHADVLITGEFRHEMFHQAAENKLAVLALGHYASEVWGVQALRQDLQKRFGLPGKFYDIPTGL